MMTKDVRTGDPFKNKNSNIRTEVEKGIRSRLFELVRKMRRIEEIYPYRGPKY